MTDQQLAPGAQAAPITITLDTAQTLLPKLAFASFDGSGAAGDFLPVIKFVGPGNIVAAQAVGDVVTAGASVDQTWFRGLAKQGGGGGIQFAGPGAVYGPLNTGVFLNIKTSGGTTLENDSGNTELLNLGAGGGLTQIINNSGNIDLKTFADPVAHPSDGVIFLEASNDITLSSNRNVEIGAADSYSTQLLDGASNPVVVAGSVAAVQNLGFFGSYVPQQIVTGSRGGNAALASLLTALAATGLIIDNSTP